LDIDPIEKGTTAFTFSLVLSLILVNVGGYQKMNFGGSFETREGLSEIVSSYEKRTEANPAMQS